MDLLERYEGIFGLAANDNDVYVVEADMMRVLKNNIVMNISTPVGLPGGRVTGLGYRDHLIIGYDQHYFYEVDETNNNVLAEYFTLPQFLRGVA